jgi:phosphate uptake regulator
LSRGLDLVVAQLDRALEALRDHNLELAAIVIAADARIDGRYIEFHVRFISASTAGSH